MYLELIYARICAIVYSNSFIYSVLANMDMVDEFRVIALQNTPLDIKEDTFSLFYWTH